MSAHHFGPYGGVIRTFAVPTVCSDLQSDKKLAFLVIAQFLAPTRGGLHFEAILVVKNSFLWRACMEKSTGRNPK